MKKIMNMWNVILIAMLSVLGNGCKIDEPPPAEYGPPPDYGSSKPYGVIIEAQNPMYSDKE